MLIIDPATGAMWKLDTPPINVTLSKPTALVEMSLRAWLFLKDEYPMTIPYTKKDKKSGEYILKTTVYSLVPAKRFAKGLLGEVEFL